MEKVSNSRSSHLFHRLLLSIRAQSATSFAYYKGIPTAWLELLVSLPSADHISLIFNKWIGRDYFQSTDDCDRPSRYALCGLFP